MDPDEDLYEKRLLMTFCASAVFLFLWCIVTLFELVRHGQETGDDEVSENHRWDYFGQERLEYMQGIIQRWRNGNVLGLTASLVSNTIHTSRNENLNSDNVRSVTVSTQTEKSDVLEPSADITSNAEMFSPTPPEPASDVTGNEDIQAIENTLKLEDNQNAVSEPAHITSSFLSSMDVDNQATLLTANQMSTMLSDGGGKENPKLTSNSVQNDPEAAQPNPSNGDESNLQETPVDKTNQVSVLQTPEDASHFTLMPMTDESTGNQAHPAYTTVTEIPDLPNVLSEQNDGETNAMHKAKNEQDLETESSHLNLSPEVNDRDGTIGESLAEGNNVGTITDELKKDFDSSEESCNERSLSPSCSLTSLTDAVLSCDQNHDEDNSKVDQSQDIQLSREILTKIDPASLPKNKEHDEVKSEEMTDKPTLLLTEDPDPNLFLPPHNSLASKDKQSDKQYTAVTATIKPGDWSSEKHPQDAVVPAYEKAFFPTGQAFFQASKEKEYSPKDVADRGSTKVVDMVDRKHCKEAGDPNFFKLKYKEEKNIAEEKVKDQTDGAYAALNNLTSGYKGDKSPHTTDDSFCFPDKINQEEGPGRKGKSPDEEEQDTTKHPSESCNQPVKSPGGNCQPTDQSRKEILKPKGNTDEKDTNACTESSGDKEYTEETNTIKTALDADSHESAELAMKKSNNANKLETTSSSQIPSSHGNTEEHDNSTPGHFTNHEPRGLDARNVHHQDDEISEEVTSSDEED